jgi:hypothetical protein
MLQSVMSSVGFDARALKDNERLYKIAAAKALTLFKEGMTDPEAIKTEMLFYFGIQKRENDKQRRLLPRYAIQGLPNFR